MLHHTAVVKLFPICCGRCYWEHVQI